MKLKRNGCIFDEDRRGKTMACASVVLLPRIDWYLSQWWWMSADEDRILWTRVASGGTMAKCCTSRCCSSDFFASFRGDEWDTISTFDSLMIEGFLRDSSEFWAPRCSANGTPFIFGFAMIGLLVVVWRCDRLIIEFWVWIALEIFQWLSLAPILRAGNAWKCLKMLENAPKSWKKSSWIVQNPKNL